MFCPFCGANLGDTPASFCSSCGKPIEAVKATGGENEPGREEEDHNPFRPPEHPKATPHPSEVVAELPPESPRESAHSNNQNGCEGVTEGAGGVTVSNEELDSWGAPAPQPSPHSQAVITRLRKFYAKYNPEKLEEKELEQILDHYQGREAKLFEDLARKYGASPEESEETYGTFAATDPNQRPLPPPPANVLSAIGKAPLGDTSLHNEVIPNVLDGLKRVYKYKVLPIEKKYKFDYFHQPFLSDVDFEANPFILLLGQYSTGKTTFIQYLLERQFPGQRIGPEPTTDRFAAIFWGKDERVIPGNALAVSKAQPFSALQKFGMAFLNKFEGAQMPCPMLKKLTFIDTPGVLSGEKQRIGRSYDFPNVIEWFAQRADRILLLFDAHKLDISDEFKRVIEHLRGQDDKIRVVLNKADMISGQQLMRVYGALMWALGKVVRTPEVPRVYIGSFWDQPYKNDEYRALFEAESQDLLADLRSIPRMGTVRKINELVKRTRMARVHAFIVNHLRNQFGWFGKKKTQDKLLASLNTVFLKVHREHNIPRGDFPNIKRFRDALENFELHKFPKLSETEIDGMNQVLGIDLPNLMKTLPGQLTLDSFTYSQSVNPFDERNLAVRGKAQQAWKISAAMKASYDNVFQSMPQTTDGRVSGTIVRPHFLKSGLPNNVLAQVWQLADMDKDRHLDSDEFAVASYVIEQLVTGTWKKLPSSLPLTLVPPSKRRHHLV